MSTQIPPHLEALAELIAVVARLRELLAEHKIMTILVKGSRSAAMEVVVRALQENGTC